MQLNELINQYSLDTIFEKTNIPKEVLERLSKKEFERFKKVQVFGFIKIIEREFSVDLSEFKQDAEQFFATHSDQKHSSASINILDADSAPSNGSGFLGIVFGLITIAIIGYGGWFFYNKESNKQEVINEGNQSKDSMFTSTLNSAKSLLGIEKNSTTTINQTQSNQKPSNSNEKQHQKFDVAAQTANTINDTTTNESQTTQKFNLNTNSEATTKEKVEELVAQSSNSTKLQESNSSQNITNVAIEQKSEQNNSIEDNNSQSSVQINQEISNNSTIDTTNTTNSEINKTILSDSIVSNTQDINNSQLEDNTTSLNTQNNINSVKLILKSKRLWIGIYNLQTKKRVSKFIKGDLDLDLSSGDLAIVTGHSMFNLDINGEVKKFGGVKKSYILLSKNEGIKVLTKQEYRKLTKRRAW